MLRTALLCVIFASLSHGAMAQESAPPGEAPQRLPEPPLIELAKDVQHAVPLSGSEVLCYVSGVFDSRAGLSSGPARLVVLDVPSGLQRPFELEWDWRADGWDEAVWPPWPVGLSTDGQWVLLQCTVIHPGYGDEPENWTMVPPDMYLACRPDGSEARAVALSFPAHYLPEPSLTAESARLVGYELLDCAPDADHFQAYLESNALAELSPFVNYVELQSGERGRFEFLPPGMYFDKCPFSDYALLDDWDGNLTFYDLLTGEETGRYSCDPGELYGYGDSTYNWVLPDAILVAAFPHERLIRVDGRVRLSPTATQHRITRALPGATAIYEEFGEYGGGPFGTRYGKLDYETFRTEWWAKRPDLTQLVYDLTPMPDGSGALLLLYGELKYLPLGREHAAGEVEAGE